jgi:hypothetical protein
LVSKSVTMPALKKETVCVQSRRDLGMFERSEDVATTGQF